MAAETKPFIDCVFCRELSGSRDTNFAKRYPELASRMIGETESLIAFPCIGQLTPGHFLIVPKYHDTTFRETSVRTSDINFQFHSLNSHVHSILGESESESLYFEHGAECADNGGCGIYHAHIHVIPRASHVELRKYFPASKESQSRTIHEALAALSAEGPYVMFGSAKHGFFSLGLEAPLPSQTLRKYVAKELNAEAWDWREAGRENNMLNFLQKVASL